MTFTLAITNFNRFELLKQSFEDVLHDERIGEVLIVDDCSEMVIFEQVMGLINLSPKIKVVRQASNRGMQQNKADAVSLAKFEWVIIFDSDNKIDSTYLDAVPDDLFFDTIYMPSAAKPEFIFKQYEGLIFDKFIVHRYIKDPPFAVLLNCSNYLVNKKEYERVYKHDPNIDGADTVNMAKNWLAAGNNFYVVPGMSYGHLVHRGSQFLKNIDKNMKDAERIKKEISQL